MVNSGCGFPFPQIFINQTKNLDSKYTCWVVKHSDKFFRGVCLERLGFSLNEPSEMHLRSSLE